MTKYYLLYKSNYDKQWIVCGYLQNENKFGLRDMIAWSIGGWDDGTKFKISKDV